MLDQISQLGQKDVATLEVAVEGRRQALPNLFISPKACRIFLKENKLGNIHMKAIHFH